MMPLVHRIGDEGAALDDWSLPRPVKRPVAVPRIGGAQPSQLQTLQPAL
jgi:hypothetical protein